MRYTKIGTHCKSPEKGKSLTFNTQNDEISKCDQKHDPKVWSWSWFCDQY